MGAGQFARPVEMKEAMEIYLRRKKGEEKIYSSPSLAL
jgi:hypothetical protein